MADSRTTPDDAPKPQTHRSRAPKATPEPAADATMTSPLPAVVPVDEPEAEVAPSNAPTQTMAAVPPEPATIPPEPATMPAPQTAPAPTATYAEQHAARAPRAPRPAPSYAAEPVAHAANPFSGVPAWDYVRDVVAALLLLISLGLQWDTAHQANERIDVILITILSVFSLAAAYLARLGALGHGWHPGRIRLTRLLLNAPYVVLVLVYLAIDIARGGDLGLEGGVGAAIGVGLAGAVLAAQPRESEAGERSGTPWLGVTAFLGAVIGVGALAGLVATAVRNVDDMRAVTLIWAILLTLITLALVVVPIVGTVVRDASWRLVLVALGGAAVVLLMTADNGYVLGLEVESFHGLGFGYVLWPAAAAAAAAPGVRRLMSDHGRRARWIGAAVHLLTLVLVVGVLQIALLVVELVDTGDLRRGSLVATLVLTVIYVLAALIARSALAQNQPQGTAIAFVVAAVLLLVGLITLAILAGDDAAEAGYVDQIFAFVVPVALAVMVAVGATRGAGGGARLAGAGAGPTTALPPRGVPGAPATGYGAPSGSSLGTGPTTSLPPRPGGGYPVGVVPPSVAIATDPRTPAATLAGLAASAPEARPYIATHPAAYPALLDWLAGLHDPAVDDALRRRGR